METEVEPSMSVEEGIEKCLDPSSLDELREVAGAQWQLVLTDFFHNGTRHEERLVAALLQRDWVAAAQVAHNIKGAYGYLGAHQLVLACAQLLLAVREDQTESGQLLLLGQAVLAEFRQVRRCLQILIDR